MAKTILIVEDEQNIVDILSFNLSREGYQTLEALDGPTGLQLALEQNPDLILLDLMLPGMDGFEVCRTVRATNKSIGIIMLTARSEDADMLMGFESGADDYVTKPFNILALKARVRALLRRASMSAAQEPAKTSVLTRGHISVDTERRSAYKNGVAIELTMKEFDLIEFLMKNPGRVYSRENLLDLVWGYDYQGDTRTVDVHIRRLREKLELDPAHPEYIVTKWGVGYYFAD